ncbi:MAG: D-aminoacyl-tRNA deacylase [Gammaproteobacteria bacterium]|nr:D-aminoacyl-tRNA deacylase [Gammaproteobacteria bacterium]
MIGLLQRVSRAQVTVDGKVAGRIGRGLLVLAAVERGDGEAQARRLAERIVGYRVFPDKEGRMNLSLEEIGGELLLVSQFTLAADTRKGTRPGFSKAAPAEEGERLFRLLVMEARALGVEVRTGIYGANMDVELVNSGPVTILLKARARPKEV